MDHNRWCHKTSNIKGGNGKSSLRWGEKGNDQKATLAKTKKKRKEEGKRGQREKLVGKKKPIPTKTERVWAQEVHL